MLVGKATIPREVCRVPRDDVPGRIKSLLKVDSTLLVGATAMSEH
jgi:hypothetical protein